MSRQKPQTETPGKHPQAYEHDLNPNAMAGQNINTANTETDGRTAYDLKQVHQQLSNLTDDNLRLIRVVPEGERLQQGATYVDLNDLEKGEFTATGNVITSSAHHFVAKKDVPYHIWNVLIGTDNQERLVDSSD